MLRCVGYCSFAGANSWKFQIASHTFWSMNLPTLTNNILYNTRRKFRTTSIDLLPYPYMESSFIGSSGALSMWLEILLIDNRMTIRFYMRVGKNSPRAVFGSLCMKLNCDELWHANWQFGAVWWSAGCLFFVVFSPNDPTGRASFVWHEASLRGLANATEGTGVSGSLEDEFGQMNLWL